MIIWKKREHSKRRMVSTRARNSRIVQNTLLLYSRMLLIMAVTLYTSRVVLGILGLEDFGIYNIVGGVVVLFSFVNNAMTTATQRFLNFSLGKNDIAELRRVFSMSVTAHISVALLTILISETVGLWFLLTQMNIPPERMNAAIWCYQFAVLTTCIQIVRVPYNACIIAYEKMSFYAYISFVEVILRLLIVFLLTAGNIDRLVLYSILIAAVALIITYAFKKVCNLKFEVSHYTFFWDFRLYKKLLSFSGWSLMGNAANVGVQQGTNILLNLFYGVVVNSAVGISNQVTNAVYSFVSNFQLAFNPPLVKCYATDDFQTVRKLIYSSSKISYFLLLVISTPLLLYSDYFLSVWLKEVPAYASDFSVLMLIVLFFDALAAPFWITIQASGYIMKYQIIVSTLILLNVPISYIFLKHDCTPITVFYVRVALGRAVFLFRLSYLKKVLPFSICDYTKKVLSPILLINTLSFPLVWFLKSLDMSLWFSLLIVTIQNLTLIFCIGLSKIERNYILSTVKLRLGHNKNPRNGHAI